MGLWPIIWYKPTSKQNEKNKTKTEVNTMVCFIGNVLNSQPNVWYVRPSISIERLNQFIYVLTLVTLSYDTILIRGYPKKTNPTAVSESVLICQVQGNNLCT